LELYGYSLTDFDQEKLYGYFSGRYRTEKSFRTAMSAIQHYLKFKGIKRKLKFVPPESAEFQEFRPLKEEELKKVREAVDNLRDRELQTALLMMLYLGLAPSEIGKLKVSSYGKFMGIPVLQEKKIKRFIIDEEVDERIRELRQEKLPISPLLRVRPQTIKVTFHRLIKRLGLDLKVSDLKDNYAARLLKFGLPIDIVVEYSGRSLERVSYINRVLTLKSKAELIEKTFKKKS
jgi:integrase